MRGAAVWALSRLDPEAFERQRDAAVAAEADEDVLAEWRQA